MPNRLHAFLAISALAVAGCTDPTTPPEGPEVDLDVYWFEYPGSQVQVAGFDHGTLLRFHNPTDHTALVRVTLDGIGDAHTGPIERTDGTGREVWYSDRVGPAEPGPALEVLPDASRIYLIQVHEMPGIGTHNVTLEVTALFSTDDGTKTSRSTQTRAWHVLEASNAVAPGDHIRTATVGVFLNGTSFYTNIPDLQDDPRFARAYPADEFDGAPLPVYVYDTSSSEQPAGSRDTCHFTTITGYNGLLKAQAEATTNVAYLRPEQAYTLPGYEEHPLYGEPLVFLNTVVAHDGSTGPADASPDPTADCYCPDHAVPRGTIPPGALPPVYYENRCPTS